MKQYDLTKLSLVIFSMLLLGTAFYVNSQSNEAIKAVIEKETEAFANADYEAWKSYWLHQEKAYFSFSNINSYSVFSGWEEIDQAFKSSIENREPFENKVRRENFKIDSSGDMAFVQFDQYDRFNPEIENHTKETRVLKKTEEGWKILSVQVINQSSYSRDGKKLHYSLFATFKPEANKSDIEFITDKFTGIAESIAGIESCTFLEIDNSDNPYDYMWMMIFDSIESFTAFGEHEYQKDVADRWSDIGNKMTVIDSWE